VLHFAGNHLPATMMFWWPHIIDWDASIMDFIPEAHTLLTVQHGVVWRRPAPERKEAHEFTLTDAYKEKNSGFSIASKPVWSLSTILLKLGQNRSYVVFPIRDKISKPGFRVAEKKNGKTRVSSGFEMNAILIDKKSIPLWNCYCWSLRNLLLNY